MPKLGMDSMPDLTKTLHHEHDKVKARMLLPETIQDELAMLLAEVVVRLLPGQDLINRLRLHPRGH